MQENEFEKKLQQKIDKLQVQPTEEVWQKIQAQVAVKRRKRRGVIFFFTLSGLIIAGLIFTDITGTFKSKRSIVAGQIKTGEKEKDRVISSSSTNSLIASNHPGQQQSPPPVLKTESATIGSTANTSPGNGTARPGSVRSVRKGAIKMSIVAALPGDIAGNTNSISTPPLPVDNTNSVDVTGNENDNETGVMANKTDSTTVIKKEDPAVATVKKETKKNNNPAVTKTKDKENTGFHKWGLSVVAAGGLSETGSSYLKNGNYEADGLGNIPTNGSNAGGGLTYLPSTTSAGISYMAGIQLYRNISSKSRLITGVQYQLFSTSIQVGQQLIPDSSALERFGNGTGKKYNNRYHFISLPLSFSTSLFSIGQHDICIDAGLTYSRLLTTNALGFNASQGIYYKDGTVFNKSQWGLNTAIKFNLSGKNKPALYIGPEFYYSLTALASSGIYSKAHNSFIGLRLQKDLKR